MPWGPFKILKKPFKAVAKVVKKVVKGVLSIFPEELRPIVLAAAIVFGAAYLAPVAASWTASMSTALGLGPVATAAVTTGATWAVKGAAASAAVTALQGGTVDDVLSATAKGAVTGAALGAAAGGVSAATGVNLPGVAKAKPPPGEFSAQPGPHIEGAPPQVPTPPAEASKGIGGSLKEWYAKQDPAVQAGVIQGGFAAVGKVGEGLTAAADMRAEEKRRQRIQDSYEGSGAALKPVQLPRLGVRTPSVETPSVRLRDLRRTT